MAILHELGGTRTPWYKASCSLVLGIIISAIIAYLMIDADNEEDVKRQQVLAIALNKTLGELTITFNGIVIYIGSCTDTTINKK